MAWTELTRRQHDRAGGKYASDLTDAEWALIVGLMPAPKKLVVHARRFCATYSTQYSTLRRQVANGGCCPMTFRQFLRFVAIFMRGAMMGCWMK